MSIHALKWAWSQNCPNPTAKLVLLAFADHANADGECYPTMARVAELAGVAARTVHDHVKALEDAGLLQRTGRRKAGGQFRGWNYLLPVEDPPTPGGSPPPVVTDRQRQEDVPASGSPPQLPVAADCRSRTVSEPPEEPPIFETDFWSPYPTRSGKKVGKKQAAAQWAKLSVGDRRLAVAAVGHYAAAADDPDVFCPVKDPWRWLRDRLFDDWQTPAVATNAPPEQQPCPECGVTLGWAGHPQCGVRVDHG